MDPNRDQAKKATKPQPVSKRLQSRIVAANDTIKSAESKLRIGYHVPGSQNRKK